MHHTPVLRQTGSEVKGLQVRKSNSGDSSLTGYGQGGQATGNASKRLVLILSTHVDDFKGAGEAHYRQRLIDGLEKAFSTLNIKTGSFEFVG